MQIMSKTEASTFFKEHKIVGFILAALIAIATFMFILTHTPSKEDAPMDTTAKIDETQVTNQIDTKKVDPMVFGETKIKPVTKRKLETKKIDETQVPQKTNKQKDLDIFIEKFNKSAVNEVESTKYVEQEYILNNHPDYLDAMKSFNNVGTGSK